MRTSDFDYALPSHLIAQTPSPIRGEDRLLTVHRNRAGGEAIEEGPFADFVRLPAPGDLIIRNDTRVRHARLFPTRPSGAPAELLLVHPGEEGDWIALGKPGHALRPGKRLTLGGQCEIEVMAILEEGERRVRFHGLSADEAIERFGVLPLPPYIAREATPEDNARYQTVYARDLGSVAAPTAGLHFTPEMFDALTGRGVAVLDLTLEVGPGTFRPVEVDDPSIHRMHPERYRIPESLAAAVRSTRDRGGSVWAIGTTVVRALESAALEDGTVTAGPGETDLLIAPGYRFKVVDRLLTNFHLPRTTLLMLVAAFTGMDILRESYERAVQSGYRFYSYGDAMVIL